MLRVAFFFFSVRDLTPAESAALSPTRLGQRGTRPPTIPLSVRSNVVGRANLRMGFWTNVVRQTPSQRAALVAFVAAEYQAGRSLRQLAELTGRTQTAIRRALDEAGVPRRGRGAPVISSRRGGQP